MSMVIHPGLSCRIQAMSPRLLIIIPHMKTLTAALLTSIQGRVRVYLLMLYLTYVKRTRKAVRITHYLYSRECPTITSSSAVKRNLIQKSFLPKWAAGVSWRWRAENGKSAINWKRALSCPLLLKSYDTIRIPSRGFAALFLTKAVIKQQQR